MEIECSYCKKELTGGIDTFHCIHNPLCQNCFFNLPIWQRKILADLLIAENELEKGKYSANKEYPHTNYTYSEICVEYDILSEIKLGDFG